MTDMSKSIKLPIKDFSKKKICDGHLYLSQGEGRRFYLMKPGIYIDEEFVKKYARTNSVFEFVPLTDELLIQSYRELFKELRYLQFERDLKAKSIQLFTKIAHAFSRGEHFLNFAVAAFSEFSAIPYETLAKMHETDMNLFRKAMYSAAFVIPIAISNDYYHYPILKDFYNVALGLDFGLCEENYSYFVAQACNQENKNPGTGLDFLKEQKASKEEIAAFLNHPDRSYEFFMTTPGILVHDELKETVLYQHELSSGKGFPRALPKGQVSSWEAIVILADALVEISDEYEFETHVMDHVENLKSKRLSELPVGKVFSRFTQALRHFDNLIETETAS